MTTPAPPLPPTASKAAAAPSAQPPEVGSLDGVELHLVHLPLITPFRLSFGEQLHREAVIVKVTRGGRHGWGECVAMPTPTYSSEYAAAAMHVITDHLGPALLSASSVTSARVQHLLAPFHGHRMAKAALEMAVLDLELREAGLPFSFALGGVKERVPSGVSIGILESLEELLTRVEGHLEQGYLRIKLKISPGWDLAPVAAVRRHFGAEVQLQVDANCAYRPTDLAHLVRLDEHGLVLVEQPFPEDDLLSHARLQAQMLTPVCLDESITDASSAAAAIEAGACRVINIKPGRVGGYLESRRVAAVAAARSVPVWCGGMLETGLGRAANLALAAGPEFTLVSDISATDRYYTEDITSRFTLTDGHIAVPTGPGLGVDVDLDAMQRHTRSTSIVRRPR